MRIVSNVGRPGLSKHTYTARPGEVFDRSRFAGRASIKPVDGVLTIYKDSNRSEEVLVLEGLTHGIFGAVLVTL